MGDEGFSFVALRRAMRIDVVYMWEIRLEPASIRKACDSMKKAILLFMCKDDGFVDIE